MTSSLSLIAPHVPHLFKNHGRKVSEEENVQQNNNLICSLEIINILLNAGANPFKVKNCKFFLK